MFYSVKETEFRERDGDRKITIIVGHHLQSSIPPPHIQEDWIFANQMFIEGNMVILSIFLTLFDVTQREMRDLYISFKAGEVCSLFKL